MLRKELEKAINRCSAENGSDTPDFVLAEYMNDCLAAFDKATIARDRWYGLPVRESRAIPFSVPDVVAGQAPAEDEVATA